MFYCPITVGETTWLTTETTTKVEHLGYSIMNLASKGK